MFKLVGIIATVVGIFWLGDIIGIEGLKDLIGKVWN